MTKLTDFNELLSAADVAKLIPYSIPSVYRLAKSKAIPSKRFNKKMFFEKSEIEKYIEKTFKREGVDICQ